MESFARMKKNKQDRLFELQMTQSRYGINTPPEVRIEIKEIEKWLSKSENIEDQLRLIEIHRRNLQLYLQQQAAHTGGYVPPMIQHGVQEARNGIARLKAALRDYYSVIVEDAPNDLETTETATTPSTSLMGPSTIEQLRADLAEVYRLLVELNDVRSAIQLLQRVQKRL